MKRIISAALSLVPTMALARTLTDEQINEIAHKSVREVYGSGGGSGSILTLGLVAFAVVVGLFSGLKK